MKNKTIIIAILIAVFSLPQLGMAQPQVVVDNPVFTFNSIPEGSLIPHEFKIKNLGDTLLRINSVLPP